MRVLKSDHTFVEVLVLEDRGDVVLRFAATNNGVRFVSKRHAYESKYELAYVPVLTFNRARAIAIERLQQRQKQLEFLRKQRDLPF
jgi:hypothetical protein